ncbi:hypothetical protein KIH07_17605 [Hydrogenophaga taeniospiralis]|jgi:hypothetical protein|uniref:hypothetical protein n=1 Tax=Hydrogenophaga taeniospiralis TaxID=65656 RepID=UPI001CF95A86|nr:hypothetical protein [Hydrogenophaga taeniospiralis]MCB4365558.1 hypothetical protein [Hydrogenophaga taeniospiralis]
MSDIPLESLCSDVPSCDQALQPQMKANSRQVVDGEPYPACDCCDRIAVQGSCHGFAVFPASQALDFYRGYALVAVPAIAMVAVASIAYFVFGLSF